MFLPKSLQQRRGRYEELWSFDEALLLFWEHALRGGLVYVPNGFMESKEKFHFLV